MINSVVKVSPEEDADFCGELLMRSLNKDLRWGYSSYELQNGWLKTESPQDFGNLDVLALLRGQWAEDYDWWGVAHIRNTKDFEVPVDAFLYWDGDGTIVFKIGDGLLKNGDMKKSYGWEWNPTWIDGYWDETNN